MSEADSLSELLSHKRFTSSRSDVVRRVHSLEFSMLSAEDAQRISSTQVRHRGLYEANSTTHTLKGGPLDNAMGPSNKAGTCSTCNRGYKDCVGHFGYIPLSTPVFNIGYISKLRKVLQAICKSCGKVLIPNSSRLGFLSRADIAGDDMLRRAKVFDAVLAKATKTKQCESCGARNGAVRKLTTSMRLVHTPWDSTRAGIDDHETFKDQFSEAAKDNPELAKLIKGAVEDLTPLFVVRLLRKVPLEDYVLLNLGTTGNSLENMITTTFVAPPVCIRPSVAQLGISGTNEDDLTMVLHDVIMIEGSISHLINTGGNTPKLMENFSSLQLSAAKYLNSDLPGFSKAEKAESKPIRALTQRLKGKTGRFRGNLSGKRVDFSARTVISPDPNLAVDQVGVPQWTARRMTFPERVGPHNIEMLRTAVCNGPQVHPGACFVKKFKGDERRFLRYGDRSEIAKNLRYGDIVERHMIDNDIVLFNRQPSLHRLSIMAHRVKVLPWRTFRFNESVCAPYNADFDGDEMNMHLLQTYESRAEAIELMGVHHNLQTPRDGEPLVTPTQDFLTASYLLSHKDVYYDRSRFMQVCAMAGDANDRIELPMPCILKPVELWSGKQVFRVLLRPNSDPTWPLVNLELREKAYVKNKYMDPRDGWVLFRNSELLCGNLAKNTLKGSKDGLVYVLIKDHSPGDAARAMSRIAKLCARLLGERGFSIGIDDVTPTDSLESEKGLLLQSGYDICTARIDEFKRGELAPQPGCDEAETLEAVMSSTLSNLRGRAGEICLEELNYLHNSPLIMSVCGSKGSPLNISQMVACVGQQTVSGSRIPNGFVGRALPHFARESLMPAARGFVANSFYSGLNVTEFFFHTMGGREGLVDTAVKTADTGYMQRRLVKALEDLCCMYDGTVRNSDNTVIQFKYGDDGLDPICLEETGPVKYSRILQVVRSLPQPDSKESRFLKPKEAISAVENLDKYFFEVPNRYRDEVLGELREQIQGALAEIEGLDTKLKNSLFTITFSISKHQMIEYVKQCCSRYQLSCMEPGTAVGAIAAQSIGEPATQMTLKTFHFAGVASMNVTLGVPRIKEIINAVRDIKTPVIRAKLDVDNDELVARIVRARIEKTTLADIAEYIQEVYTPGECYVAVKIDMDAVMKLQLELDMDDILDAVLADKTMKLKPSQICVLEEDDCIKIEPSSTDRDSLLFKLHTLTSDLPGVVVKGLSSVSRAVINNDGKGCFEFIVEGKNLLDVLTTPGVKGSETTSNNIMVVYDTLGVEAARSAVMTEIISTMQSHGLSLDVRHVMLLADLMTYRG